MANPSATPTPITPPRVPLIDARTGLIDRAWYMFFLSLFQSAQISNDSQLGSNAESLIASYDEALRTLAQATETQPPQPDCCDSIDAVRQEVQTTPTTGVAELAQEVSDLRQEVKTLPQPQLGTFAALQQANLPWTTFDTTPESLPTDVGTVAWGGGTTLGVQMTANVLQRVGESEYVYAKASAAITKGQLCYHTGAVGASGVITVAPTPLNLADPNQLVGVAAETLALNDFGLIQVSGVLRGFNTTGSSVGETWADGDALYYNPAFVGSMTKVKPLAPNQKSYIGEVINAASAGSGSMHIRIVPGSVLGGTDSNVEIISIAANDLLVYDSVDQRWENRQPTGIFNIAALSANSVLYLNASKTVTTSSSLFFNGTNLGAGTNSPNRRLEVLGAGSVPVRISSPSSNMGVEYVSNGGTVFNWFAGAQYNIGNAFEITPSTAAGGTTFSTPALLINSSRNVGVDTNSPSAKFVISDAGARGMEFSPNASGLGMVEIYNRSTAAYYGFRLNADEIRLYTGSSVTERVRVDSSGNFGLNGTTFGSGVRVMFIGNATTVPTTNPTGGGVLYTDAGALKYRGSSGTVTTIANA